MINRIIDGVVKALDEAFSLPIYTENTEQGLTEPCFSVYTATPTEKLFLGKRYLKHTPVVVNYFPSSGLDQKSECNSIIDELFNVLEYIEVNDSTERGSNMNAVISDGVVVFTVDYDFFIIKTNTDGEDLMESYTEGIEVNEENT